MTQIRRKKRLRDRVAARRAGRSEYIDDVPLNPLRKKLSILAWVLQGGSLLLLAAETVRLFLNGFSDTDFDVIIAYAALFFIGRFMHMGVQYIK